MAKSRDSARDPPVESEEESEEEEGSSAEEEGSESESEPEPPPTKISQVKKKPASASVSKKPKPQPSKTQSADSSSSDDEESDSEADSDSPIKKPDPNVKPIASKPMDDSQKAPNTKKPRSKPMDDAQKTSNTKKPRSKPNATGLTSPAKSPPPPAAGTKRPSAAADGEAKEAKRSKKKSETVDQSLEEKGKKKSETRAERLEEKGVSTDDSKKLFQRLWSEDDEIVILQGMIDYRAKKKADPLTDLNVFLEFIKKSIHIDVSTVQLRDKIRRLKKKYENNFSKEKKGKQKVSPKPHEQKAYELSKKIWGKKSNGVDNTIESPKTDGTAVKRNRTKNPVAPDEREEAVAEDNRLGGEKGVEGFKDVCTGLGREEMEGKWKNLKVEEIGVYLKKVELMLEQTKSIWEAIKLSGN